MTIQSEAELKGLQIAGRVAAELDLAWEASDAVALRGSFRWVQDFTPAPA